MALFGTKKTKEKIKDIATAKKEAMPKTLPTGNFSAATDMIIRPHVTEKTGLQSQNNVYTFQVTKNANKPLIAKAIKNLYKVTPTKITVINIPAKNVFVRGKWGSVPAMRKALVTLKSGDKIDFV